MFILFSTAKLRDQKLMPEESAVAAASCCLLAPSAAALLLLLLRDSRPSGGEGTTRRPRMVGPRVANEGGVPHGPRGAKLHARLADRDGNARPSDGGVIRGTEMYCDISGCTKMYCDISGGA